MPVPDALVGGYTRALLAATFFGQRDQWNEPGTELNFTTAAEIRRLLAGWELIELTEIEEDGQTADGSPKHWHVFHVIARRPPA